MVTHEERIATAGTYTGSAIAAFSGLTLNEWGVVVGIVLGTLSFIANIWFKHRILRLARDRDDVNFNVD